MLQNRARKGECPPPHNVKMEPRGFREKEPQRAVWLGEKGAQASKGGPLPGPTPGGVAGRGPRLPNENLPTAGPSAEPHKALARAEVHRPPTLTRNMQVRQGLLILKR